MHLTKFYLLKPWFVRRLTSWSTCCYRYHTEVGLLLRALNEFRKDPSGIHVACSCDCQQVCSKGDDPTSAIGCSASLQTYESFSGFWSLVLYPIGPRCLWHNRECLLGECLHCGVDTLKICPLELECTQLVPWKSIGYEIIGQGEDGREKKSPKVMYSTVPGSNVTYKPF